MFSHWFHKWGLRLHGAGHEVHGSQTMLARCSSAWHRHTVAMSFALHFNKTHVLNLIFVLLLAFVVCQHIQRFFEDPRGCYLRHAQFITQRPSERILNTAVWRASEFKLDFAHFELSSDIVKVHKNNTALLPLCLQLSFVEEQTLTNHRKRHGPG